MKKSFTLIELLVVIAIIAILAAILLPALSKARNRGKAIQCTSQMKNFGSWEALYQSDFRDFIVPPIGDNEGFVPNYYTSNYHWDYVFASRYLTPGATSFQRTNRAYRVFLCPLDNSPMPRPSYLNTMPRSYSFAIGWARCAPSTSATTPSAFLKIGMVKKPSESIFISEHNYETSTKYGNAAVAVCNNGNKAEVGLWNAGSVGTYHDGRAPILLLDGHIVTRGIHLANSGTMVWANTTTANFLRYILLQNHSK